MKDETMFMPVIAAVAATSPAAVAATALADPNAAITVIASREAVPAALSGTALTIIDRQTIEALNLPQVKDFLTLSPSVSVSQTGPLGSQTQVRIRGAEANQTLTFVDGIDVTDPASSGEFRFETLLADGIERIEVLRGPQSALWGSQAVGGVINITTRSDYATRPVYGQLEGGSLGTVRAGIGGGLPFGEKGGISGLVSYLGSEGYDISDSGGDNDGFRAFTVHAKADLRPSENTSLLFVARYTDSNSQFDDFDFAAGVPLDAALSTRVSQLQLRGQAGLSLADDRWTQALSIFYSGTRNENEDDGAFLNRSDGSRTTLRYQTSYSFEAGRATHRITGALEHDRETFDSRDVDPAALSNQFRSRLQTSLIGEYRLDVGDWLGGGFAVRHDWNSPFADATTWRVTAAVKPGAGFTLHGSYGTGVTDPTFFELFGFFPDFFVGNPDLTPESSSGWDLGAGWSNDRLAIDVTWFQTILDNEIVSTFDFTSFLSGVENASGRSRRRGLEVSANAVLAKGLTFNATYAWLDASEQRVAGTAQVREVRRPPHSGSVTLNYQGPVVDLAASAAITGARDDTDFARFVPVVLPSYTLLTLSGAWHVSKRIDLTARIQNALDQRYQDVFAYNNPGITGFIGVRLRG
jgi:vitamin B12 transporter